MVNTVHPIKSKLVQNKMASFMGRTAMLMLVLLFLTTTCDALKRKFVVVRNDLDGGKKLTVHCKSADDDLGVKVLPPTVSFEFNFKPSWVTDTLFYCSFEWPGAFHWFDIYLDQRDLHECSQCWWSIKSTGIGPCRYNFDNNLYDKCFPWNQN